MLHLLGMLDMLELARYHSPLILRKSTISFALAPAKETADFLKNLA